MLEIFDLYVKLKIFLDKIGLTSDDKYILITFHPQTILSKDNKTMLSNLLFAVKLVPFKKLFTYPNGDVGSDVIIEELKRFYL